MKTGPRQPEDKRPESAAESIRALSQPLHLYEYLTHSHHYHFGCFKDPQEPLASAMDRLVLRCVPLLVPGGRTLDVGCGMGGTSALLAASGFPTVGIDPEGGSIDFARRTLDQQTRLVFSVMGIQDLMNGRAHGLGPFDNIVIFEVLQYLPPLLELFNWCCSTCRPGGVVVINDVATVPDLGCRNVPFPRQGALRAVGEAAGLELIESQVITSSVTPTLGRLIGLLEESREETVSFFGAERGGVEDEISELISQWKELRRGFANQDLVYETVVLRRKQMPADHG
ncbi:MAG: class I SAM-dependent methyltransferase [Planctomycetota bacterium]